MMLRAVVDPDGEYAVLRSSHNGTVELQTLEETVLGTFQPTDTFDWTGVDAASLVSAPLRVSGGGYAHVDDLEDRPVVVASPSLVFVVPDHTDDEFRRGGDHDAFVRSTHADVRAFDAAAPTEPSAKRYKRVVEGIEARARARLDDARFKRGEA